MKSSSIWQTKYNLLRVRIQKDIPFKPKYSLAVKLIFYLLSFFFCKNICVCMWKNFILHHLKKNKNLYSWMSSRLIHCYKLFHFSFGMKRYFLCIMLFVNNCYITPICIYVYISYKSTLSCNYKINK